LRKQARCTFGFRFISSLISVTLSLSTLPIEILLRLALEKGVVIAKRKVDYQSAYD
jgi:hypothetical protein